MRGHLLVDLDNVLDGLDAPALETFVQRAARRLGVHRTAPRVSSCVVSFAFNTDTATRHELAYGALREAAKTLAQGLIQGTGAVDVELALALTMPQAADVLLERLARESPSNEASGPYGYAAVFSSDRGLASSLAENFYVRDGSSGWLQIAADDWLGTAWTMPPGGRAIIRKPPPKANRPAEREDPANIGEFTICISGDALAAWAGTRPIDLSCDIELPGLANLVVREPWLLSQIGPTRTTVRGMSRLVDLPTTSKPPLGPLSPSDGVEVRGRGIRPSEGRKASGASIGIGAVRFSSECATVASRLPVSVLSAHAGSFRVDIDSVNTRAALAQFPVGVALGTQTVNVRLAARGPDLVAKVVHAATTQPQLWWVRDSAVQSECRVRAGALVPVELLAAAAPMRAAPGGAYRVVLRSPLAANERVKASAGIPARTIGQGWTVDDRKPRPVAILATRGVTADEVVSVVPIHEASSDLAVAGLPEELLVLPLVVQT